MGNFLGITGLRNKFDSLVCLYGIRFSGQDNKKGPAVLAGPCVKFPF